MFELIKSIFKDSDERKCANCQRKLVAGEKMYCKRCARKIKRNVAGTGLASAGAIAIIAKIVKSRKN